MLAIDPEDIALLHMLEAALAGDSLIEFIPRISPRWEPPWHLKPLADLFARAEYGPIRACVSVPPRHSKTETLIHGIVWWLSRHPEQSCVYASYGGGLAVDKSKRALDLALQAGISVRKDARRGDNWRTVQGGGLRAVGTGGSLTGHGANLLIIDDPLKDRVEAESTTIRNQRWDWFTSTAMTRVEPGGSVIVTHTRWHQDDMIGRLQNEGGWEMINLPAYAQHNDMLGRKPGDALWPTRWPLEELQKRHKEVGEYDWSSLYMGEPRPKGGRLFKEPQTYDFPAVDRGRPVIVCDPAASSKNYSDYSAIVVGLGWVDPQTQLPHLDILDVHRIQVEVPVLVSYLQEIQRKWQAPVAIESQGGFKAVAQSLRRINPSLVIREITTQTDKFTRALPVAAAWNDGRVRIPSPDIGTTPKWLVPFLQEVQTFTGVGDVHDDQVDALAHLYNLFAEHGRSRGLGVRPANIMPFG